MKPWYIGALIGGIIGLIKVMDFIFYPVIGALIGAGVTKFVYWFVTTKTEVWKKGAIIGAIWGLFGIFVGFNIIGSGGGGTGLQIWLRGLPDIVGYFIALPSFIVLFGLKFIDPSLFSGGPHSWSGLIIWPIVIIFSPVVGALVGSVFGYLIEKWRWKNE